MAKSKYDTHVAPKLDLVEQWAKAGLSMAQIAKNLGIAESTLHLHTKHHSEFSEAIKRGKEEADIDVENAIHRKAIGYTYDEVTYGTEPDPTTGEMVRVEKKRVTKHVPGDVSAQIFWLKNRKPTEWNDRRTPPVDESDKGNLDQMFESLKQSAELYLVKSGGKESHE